MKTTSKTIALIAIGVAVGRVSMKRKNNQPERISLDHDDYSIWIMRSSNKEQGFQQMADFLEKRNRLYIAHESFDEKIIIYSKPKSVN